MAVPSAFSIPLNVAFVSRSLHSLRKPGPASAAPSLFVFVGLTLICWSHAYSLAIGAATFAVSESYLGLKVYHPRGSYSKVRGKFWKIVGVVSVAFLRAIGMFVLIEGVGVGVIVGILSVVLAATARPAPPNALP